MVQLIAPKSKPAVDNVVDLMEALRRSVRQKAAPARAAKPAKKLRKAVARLIDLLVPRHR
ncbi:hypothetical protein [Bradyrhizobium pachyrhizi]|uniref:hypothetical protein n=1 Tax=Bradyrhizobium pachyrhizi TaxID=280333 RepID=UPI003D36ADF5